MLGRLVSVGVWWLWARHPAWLTLVQRRVAALVLAVFALDLLDGHVANHVLERLAACRRCQRLRVERNVKRDTRLAAVILFHAWWAQGVGHFPLLTSTRRRHDWRGDLLVVAHVDENLLVILGLGLDAEAGLRSRHIRSALAVRKPENEART